MYSVPWSIATDFQCPAQYEFRVCASEIFLYTSPRDNKYSPLNLYKFSILYKFSTFLQILHFV